MRCFEKGKNKKTKQKETKNKKSKKKNLWLRRRRFCKHHKIKDLKPRFFHFNHPIRNNPARFFEDKIPKIKYSK